MCSKYIVCKFNNTIIEYDTNKVEAKNIILDLENFICEIYFPPKIHNEGIITIRYLPSGEIDALNE